MANITLVDDDENIVASVSLALESHGHKVTAFHDGAAGLEALENAYNPPRLNLYNDWRGVLEAQLERSLKGGTDPKAALVEAQRQALLLK